MEKGWVLLYTINKPYRAEIIKDKLEESNINCIVINKQDSVYGTFGDVEIYVNENDAHEAEKIIKNFED